MVMLGPLWPDNGCWLGLQWCLPPRPAVTLLAVCCGDVFALIVWATIIVTTGPSLDLPGFLLGVVPSAIGTGAAVAARLFHTTHPAAVSAGSFHLGYALGSGISLSMGFRGPIGCGALAGFVARLFVVPRLPDSLPANSMSLQQFLIASSVSVPLILGWWLGLAIYIVCNCA